MVATKTAPLLANYKVSKTGTIQLRQPSYSCLAEALRRNLMFGSRDYMVNKALNKKWLGLGLPSEYKQAVEEGWMTLVHPPSIPKVIQWYKLTDKGVKVIEHWLSLGCTLDNFHNFYPDWKFISPVIPMSIFDEQAI